MEVPAKEKRKKTKLAQKFFSLSIYTSQKSETHDLRGHAKGVAHQCRPPDHQIGVDGNPENGTEKGKGEPLFLLLQTEKKSAVEI